MKKRLGLCVGGLLLWAALCQAQTGSLQVTLGPAGANTAGATWNVDGGVWQTTGATVTGLSAGSHDVYFNYVSGWASPVSTPVTITAGATTPVTGTYLQLAGSLTVQLQPADALAAGAQWNAGGSPWQNGGATIGGLTVGSGCTINYSTIAGWAPPPSASATISSTGATTATAAYLQTAGTPFMTLTPLSTATWNDWFSLWDEDNEHNFNWESTVEIPDNFTAPEGAGEFLDWNIAPALTGFYYGYMATGDTSYVDMMVTCVNEIISLEVIEPDGYPGWPTMDPSMTGVDNLDSYNADSMLGDAAAFRPIVLMACQMTTNPALQAKYGATGQSYIQLAEQLYAKWVSRGGWRDTAGGGMTAVVLPYGMDPTNTTWIDYDTRNDPGNGFSNPANKADEIALWLLAMWDVTGNPEYEVRAAKWFTLMKSQITPNGDGTDAIWDYWQPEGPWDYIATATQETEDGGSIGDPKQWVGIHPNDGYYQTDVQCIVAAFEHGVVFNEADITVLIATAKTGWTGSVDNSEPQAYFNPSNLFSGMLISVLPATGTATAINACYPNSLTSQPISAGAGALNGTIVSVTWDSTSSMGNVVVQPSGLPATPANQVTIATDGNTVIQFLRMWPQLVAYDTQIQQQFEENEDANAGTASNWGSSYDSYYLWLHSTLTVQSTPPTGLSIGSSMGQGYTTNYAIPGQEYSPTVNLQAPAADPAGYTFAEWAVNGTNQTARVKSITFARYGPTTAVAQYLPDATLAVQSTPPTGLSIGSSSGDGGTTNYTVAAVAAGTSVNLTAPATDPAGYTFSQWTVNGTAQTAGLKSITFAMPTAAIAVAQYTPVTYILSVQSTPVSGLSISSNSGYGGTTNYTVGVAYGTSVDLEAPDVDWAGDSFVQWVVNGQGYGSGNTVISFTVTGDTTAWAQYTGDTSVSTLLVLSAPPTGLSIGSSTGDAGTTDYSLLDILPGTTVNLSAPAADPSGYVFSEWTVNGAALTAAQKSVTFSAATDVVWTSGGTGDWQFDYPAAIAVDSLGNVYVANLYNNLIQKFTSAGVFITQWGGFGSGNGQFSYPSGVAIGSAGNVYVTDYDNNRIQVFTSAGAYLTQWGSYGSGSGQFEYPTGIAADSAGNIYVADSYNDRIQEFTSAGEYVAQWGSSGSGNGQFSYPYGVAVDGNGYVYVADSGNSRIQKFTSYGYYLGQWGSMGGGDGQFSYPYGVACDNAGNVYVADTADCLVQEFTSGGTYITQWGGYGSNNGQLEFAEGIAVDKNGEVYVADTANDRIEVFYLNILAVAQYLTNTTLAVQSTPPTGLSIGSSSGDGGTTNYTVSGAAAGTSVNLIAPATDPTGYSFSQWTVNGAAQTAGLKSITFAMPAAATAVAQYTPITYTLAVQSTTLTGLSVGSYSGYGGTTNYTVGGIAYGTSVDLEAPATDSAGDTFVQWVVNGASYGSGNTYVSFALTGATTAVAQYNTLNISTMLVQSTPPTGLSIGSSTSDGGTTNYSVPGIISGSSVNLAAPATDPAGYIFSEWTLNGVAQTAGQKSVTFPAPIAWASWGSSGTGDGQFYSPAGIAVSSAGNVYVADTDNNLVQKFTSAGVFVTQWGGSGSGDGQFEYPYGIAVDTKGNVYVADTGNNRIQKFTSGGTYVAQWGGYGSGNGQFEYPYGIALDSAGNNVYVTDADNYRIQKFTSGGTYVAQWGGQGSGNGQFEFPYGIAFDSTGNNVYVTDVSSDLVQKFTSAGVFVTQWGGFGVGSGQLDYPYGIAVDASSNVYVADAGNARIEEFTSGGAYVIQWGGSGSGNGQLDYPEGVAVDSVGNVYVADTDNDRVQVFYPTILAVAQYLANATLAVQSTPVTGLRIGSSTGDGGTTNYTVSSVAYGTSVNLQAPAANPAGYAFSQWEVNGAAQTAGQKSITFTMAEIATAVAQYTPVYALNVQSTPPTGIVITSGTADGGTTSYTVSSVAYGASVNLQAPATDPAGYAFSQWTVNGSAQTAGQKSITFTMIAAATVVAQYTPVYALTVQSTPPTGIVITSGTADGGTTNYTVSSVAYGASANLAAPATDPGGYTFSQWTLNGAAQSPGQKSIAFTMEGAVTAVAHYTPNMGYALSVKSTPPTGLSIGSSTGQRGTTNCTIPGVGYGASVNLAAPATDPAGYAFSQWTVNGAAQSPGQKSITFTMDAAVTAVAHYTANIGYTLSMQSMPPTGLSIGSYTGHCGTTNCAIPGVCNGTSVNVVAPVTDPAAYTFSRWTVNGAAQSPGQKSITFTMDAAVTAVAHYTANTGYTLTVQSMPPVKQVISSSTGQSGTTNYTKIGVAYGASVNVQAPATDPAGYTFSQWTLNGAAQPDGQKSITFTMDAAVTAVAHYTANIGYTLSVQSVPPGKQVITSSTFHGGVTNYTVPGVAYGTTVNVQAPATDPAGYTFSQWTVNGAAQIPGQKSVTFTMDGAVTAVAEYTANVGYALSVQSTPPVKQVISSSTGQNGTTNYTKTGVANGTSVNLQAPAVDPAGFAFSQWTVNGAAQSPGQKSIMFTMDGVVTAVAEYTANVGYALSVKSTPPTGLSIVSSTGQGGTTNYTKADVVNGTNVNLQAPAADPAGYIFSQWTINGAAQSSGQKSVAFTVDGAMTAVAQYTLNGYALTVESTPPTGLAIGSSTGQKGTTNYYLNKSVADGTSVNLQAPATDPAGYTFLQWMVNGAAQTAGQKSITFAMDGDMTALAQYALNGYTLTMQSMPPTGLSIGSSTGHCGTTNCAISGVCDGTSVNVVAPDTDPAGYTFSQWTLNSAAQSAGEKSITFTMDAAVTAVAHYTANASYTLSVQSTPPAKQVISSSTGQTGTTNYTVPGIGYGASVNVQAPATDPAGYTFSQWTLNGAAQPDGQKSITFTMDAAVTAIAHYTANTGHTLSVQSAPPAKQVITSSTFHGGVTNYTVADLAYGTSVNVQAPATDPAGYTFSQWTVNGAAQSPGQRSVTFTMDGAATAVAEYTANVSYTLTVQSTPPAKQVISSSTGQNGTTNYTKAGVGNGTSVNLQAPATDPAGYAFSQWTVNGAAQAPGQKSITFTMDGAMTAVAQYTANVGYTLSVQSTPPATLAISSSTGQNGTTNYTKAGIAYGASVNLQTPATDPAGYTFSQWTVNGAAQTPGQKSVTFAMDGIVTAVAEYTANAAYTLTVQSTPATGLSIGSSTGQHGKTNYTKAGIAYGASVNLQAPATDPTGYAFSQWTVNGAAQSPGQKSVTFTITAATTAVAVYVKHVP